LVNSTFLSRLALLATLFALGVVGLGAFTRLIDAGLGCPDWPGCYGHFTVAGAAEIAGNTLIPYKAWAEMVHRYFVAGLSVFILAIVITIFSKKTLRTKSNLVLALLLLSLLMYQIILGMLTVTLKLLPIIVTQHLLGGFLILSLLWLLYLNNKTITYPVTSQSNAAKFLPWAIIAVIILVLQISLGAWTSTNYASLSCSDFPFCSEDSAMTWQFKQAFTLHTAIGINYEGGVLPQAVRQTIHMMHRLGALIFSSYILVFLIVAVTRLKNAVNFMGIFYLIIALLIVQICMGISNVLFQMPLITAVSHNVIAVLLLLSLVTLTYRFSQFVGKE
jgi:heme a synthase